MSQVGAAADVKVGAAVMTMQGNIYQGSNMEAPAFASAYGTSLTAEDCAIFKALSDGQKEFKAISVHVKHLDISSSAQNIQQHSSSAVATPVALVNNAGPANGTNISPRVT
jgi:cytidine deaminase